MPKRDRVRQALPNQRMIIEDALYKATKETCQRLGCTGVSFVTSSINIWAGNLHELSPKATADFLRALADQVEGGGPVGDSEERRQVAVRELFQRAEEEGLRDDPPQGSA